MRDINYSCIFSSQIINVNTKKFLPYAVVSDKMERDTVVSKDNTIEYKFILSTNPMECVDKF